MRKLGFIICFFIFISSTFGQGKLGRSKAQFLKKGTSSKFETNHRVGPGGNPFLDAIAEASFHLAMYVGYYAFVGSYGDEFHLENKIANYPYFDELSGNYTPPDSSDYFYKKFRLDFDNRILYGGELLFADHVKINIRPTPFFYFRVDFLEFVEYTDNVYDVLSVLGVNFCYDRVRYERFNLGWRLGVGYVGNTINKAGFNIGVETDIFVSKPLSLNASLGWCIINEVPFFQDEIQCRFHINKLFVSIGYEYFRIASPQYHFVSLGFGGYF